MSDPAVATQPLSKVKALFRRLTSTVILWTVVLAAMFTGNKLIADGVVALFMVVLAFSFRFQKRSHPALLPFLQDTRKEISG